MATRLVRLNGESQPSNRGPIGAPTAYGSGTGARIVFGDGSSVVELNASTGQQMWSFTTGGTVSGGVAFDNTVSAAGPSAGPDLKLSLRPSSPGPPTATSTRSTPRPASSCGSRSTPGRPGHPRSPTAWSTSRSTPVRSRTEPSRRSTPPVAARSSAPTSAQGAPGRSSRRLWPTGTSSPRTTAATCSSSGWSAPPDTSPRLQFGSDA